MADTRKKVIFCARLDAGGRIVSVAVPDTNKQLRALGPDWVWVGQCQTRAHADAKAMAYFNTNHNRRYDAAEMPDVGRDELYEGGKGRLMWRFIPHPEGIKIISPLPCKVLEIKG